MSSYDITFCCKFDCPNKDCKRHRERLKNYEGLVSMSMFPNCEYWGNTDLKLEEIS